MQHGVVPHQDREVAALVGCVEAEAVAVVRHRCTHVADRKRGNGSLEAGDSPTIKTRHARRVAERALRHNPSPCETQRAVAERRGDTIALVAFRAGTHTVGGDSGVLQVRTYREGVAQKAGHDLIIDVEQWEATAEVGEDGTLSAVRLHADPRSLQVREGMHGVKPLTDKDRAGIRKTMDEKILRGRPIAFRSSAVELAGAALTVRGELDLAGTTRPVSFELALATDGRVGGTLAVTQSEWGIKPYRGLMGALKVRDTIEIVLDVRLPSD